MTSLIVGAGDFKKAGKEFLRYFIEYTGLKSDHCVLEIGAGYGRMAVGLTDFLAKTGKYDGIEIIEKAVRWCNREISSRYPNFHFHHADVQNRYSNPQGKHKAADYQLPFANSTFDLVFLTSVFSHMSPSDIDRYLMEISRVLKSGGACFATYYLLNDFSLQQLKRRTASQPFYHAFDGYLSTSRNTPENTIAIPEEAVRAMYKNNNLEIEEPIRYGAWSGRDDFLTYQDVIIARHNLTRVNKLLGRDENETHYQ